jgi:hypothetical protein
MIKTNSVFILGAGASVPYGYPTGFELVQEIKTFLSNFPFDPRIAPKDMLETHMFFKQLVNSLSELDEFYNALLKASTYSIDKFLENRPDYLELGKLLITYILKKKENEHRLFIGLKESNWLAELFNRIDANEDNIPKNRISFITFNYDRSLEFFIYNLLKSRSTKGGGGILKLLSNIPIVHVYGSLGCFPWEDSSGIPYSWEFKPKDIRRMANNIQIMSDEVETEELKTAHILLNSARNIHFIGFGYDYSNMQRLKIVDFASKKNINGTALKIPETRRKEIETFFNCDVSIDPVNNKKSYSVFPDRKIFLAGDNEDIMHFLDNYVSFEARV